MTAINHIFQFIIFSYVLLGAGELHAAPMKFEAAGNGGNCHNDCVWISAEGEFVESTPSDFLEFIKKHRGGDTIYFNSGGGSIMAALKLGTEIRNRGFSTAIGKTVPFEKSQNISEITSGVCASACAFAFIGGVARKAENKTLGAHQFYNGIALNDPNAKIFTAYDVSAQQFMSAILIDYTMRMGVDPRFIALASMEAPTSMYYFSTEEMDSLNLTYAPRAFRAWTIEPYKGGIIAFSKSKDNAHTTTLFCSGKKAYLMLDTDGGIDLATYKQVLAQAAHIDVLGFKLPTRNVGVSSANNKTQIRIDVSSIKDQIAKSYETKAFNLNMRSYLPHVYWELINYDLNPDAFSKTASLALKNCIH